MLAKISVSVLLLISGLLGVKDIPQDFAGWKVASPWTIVSGISYFSAQSESIVTQCRNSPESFVEFPPVIHGSHRIFLDGQLINQFGSETFDSVETFYGAPVMRCSTLSAGRLVEWKIANYTQYFARVPFFPRLSK